MPRFQTSWIPDSVAPVQTPAERDAVREALRAILERERHDDDTIEDARIELRLRYYARGAY